MFRRFIYFFLATFIFSFSAQARETETTAPVSALSQEDLKLPEQEIPVLIQGARLDTVKVPAESVSSNTTVISKKELKSAKPETFQEAVQFQEGVVLYDAVGNGRDMTFSLRGFDETSVVTFLVDGVRMNELDGNFVRFPLISMDDIDHIQIERGSASPVYGSNAIAGVVNITTGRPSKKPWSLFGGLDISSHHGIHFYQGFSGTVQDKISQFGGAFEYYFKGGRNVGDGFRGNSDYRITNFDIKTAYVLPEESGKFYINVKHTVDRTANPGEMTFNQYQSQFSTKLTNKPLDYQKFVDTIVQLGAEKKFWDNKIRASIMTDWRLLRRNAITTFGTFTDFVTGASTEFVSSKARDNNLIWQIAYDDQWDWLANHSLIGMEFRRSREYALQVGAPGGVITSIEAADRIGHAHDTALFWDERLSLTKYADVHFGMRHDFYALKADDHFSAADSFKKDWHSSTVSTGLTLHPHTSTDVFLNYSQGFRVPSLSDVSSLGFGAANPGLRPEKSNSYEMGSRYHYKDLFKLRGSWFLIDMEDEIAFDTTAITALNPFGQNTNIGKSRRQGIETGMELHPAKEVSFFGTYTLTTAYVRETDGGGSIKDGRTIGQIPQNRLAWGTEVNPLIRLGEPFAGLKFRMDGTFTGQQHPTGYESAGQGTLNVTGGAGHIIKSYMVWNFLTSYMFKNQEIYFKINNMLNNKYYSRAVSGFADGTSVYPLGTYTFVNPGAPREYLLGMRWEIE